MARLESIKFLPQSPILVGDKIVWTPAQFRKVDRLPQLFWEDGSPWREANLWLHERAFVDHKNSQTVLACATAVLAYAKWLEQTQTKWWDFPERKKDRCLVRYRGDLIAARDKGQLAPSTTSERMRVVINFYRWLKVQGVLSVDGPLWADRVAQVNWADSFGMKRTLAVLSSELAIPNRSMPCDGPEQGLFPVSTADRDAFLLFAKEHASEELFLFLSLGFFTGMRLGSLADLKLKTLANAVPDQRCKDLFRLSIGPGARPPVATKFGVTGASYIPRVLLERLRGYANSTRRLLRQAKAGPAHGDLVFLTKYGNPYAQRGLDKSVAINVEMWAIKKKASAAGIEMARDFWFHQSRATFGTELARIILKHGSAQEAVAMVMEALLQRNESSALHYIRFVERTPIKIDVANEFTRAFLGVVGRSEESNGR